jgi:hypothetical protein
MTWVEESVPLTKENIDNLLKYLPLFEEKANKFYVEAPQDKPGVVVLPFYLLTGIGLKFYEDLYKEGFVTKFRWMNWIAEAGEYSANDEKLSKADIMDIRRLFTIIVRQDRYCEGLLEEVIESGLVLKILRRLKEIREEME